MRKAVTHGPTLTRARSGGTGATSSSSSGAAGSSSAAHSSEHAVAKEDTGCVARMLHTLYIC